MFVSKLTLLLFSLLLMTGSGPVAAQSIITTVAGGGPVDGPALSTPLGNPQGIARDSAGNFYIAATGLNRVFKVDPSGQLTTVAGNGSAGFSGDGGPATSARLSSPTGVAVDGS